jgi:hypothetical protein
MKFPLVLEPELGDSQLARYRGHVDSDASGWHRRWTESIWRRHQHPTNARLSGWSGEGDCRRRIIHFHDEYGVEGRAFVLRRAYLWLCVTLPDEDVDAYAQRIDTGLGQGGWTPEKLGRWRRGDLAATVRRWRIHPEDERRGYAIPPRYSTLEMRIQTDGYAHPADWHARPWKVFHEVGLRHKLARGAPREISPEAIAEFLPAQLELGCGPSIEAGVPELSSLHRIYGVSLPDYRFIFRAEQDSLLEVVARPEAKYREMAAIYRACLLARETDFYRTIRALWERGDFVGPVITNNFDCLCAEQGLAEISLRKYDVGPYYPRIAHDPQARSLLVVGVHADRRLVQMRAREQGLRVIFVDPEQYVAPDGARIHYPVEAPQDEDLFVRATAHEALTRLHARVSRNHVVPRNLGLDKQTP